MQFASPILKRTGIRLLRNLPILFFGFVVFGFGLSPCAASDLAFQSPENFKQDSTSISSIKVTALANPSALKEGEAFNLFVRIHVASGWHIYAMNLAEEDQTLATRVALEVDWLEPQGAWVETPPKLIFDGALNKGILVHSKTAQFHRTHRIAGSLVTGSHPINGALWVRACNNRVCTMPKRLDFSTSIQVIEGSAP